MFRTFGGISAQHLFDEDMRDGGEEDHGDENAEDAIFMHTLDDENGWQRLALITN